MPEKEQTNYLREKLKEFSYYLADFFMSVLIGLGLSILLDLPLKFARIVNLDLGHFIVHFLGMCIALYVRCYRRSYSANKYTYSFQLKKVLLYIGMIFVVQILLILIIGIKNGGHAVYVAGPSRWLATYTLPFCHSANISEHTIFIRLNWLFMILSDILIYAPIMIIGEYLGSKANSSK